MWVEIQLAHRLQIDRENLTLKDNRIFKQY